MSHPNLFLKDYLANLFRVYSLSIMLWGGTSLEIDISKVQYGKG